MLNADFTPDLEPLTRDYQILAELDHSAGARSYLARHLELNRDVAISVLRAASADDRQALERFEADIERLKTLRHSNVIPVIEGRRLNGDQLAVVRARVRGSSLDQLVSAVGAIPQQRVGAILEQVQAALDWARENGLSVRHIGQDAMIFQQGSGRVLLSFDIAPDGNGQRPDACDDARTIGTLAWEMLSGTRLEGAELKSLANLRPELSRAIVLETNALVHCWHGGPARDVGAYIAMLGATEPPQLIGHVRDVPPRAHTPPSALLAALSSPPAPVASPASVASTPKAMAPMPMMLIAPAVSRTATRRAPSMRFVRPHSDSNLAVRLIGAAVIIVLGGIGFFVMRRGHDAPATAAVAPDSTPAPVVAPPVAAKPKPTPPKTKRR